MGSAENRNKVSAECLGKAARLTDLIDYSKGTIVSKTLVDKKSGTVTLFAFDAGQGLSEHRTPYDAVVQVIGGSAELTIGEQIVTACAGQVVIMPANIPHSVRAEEKFKMMLIMIHG